MYHKDDSQQLIYGLTHDLAAPLRGISNFAMLISRRYGDQLDEKGQKWLNFLIDDGFKAEKMVKGLVQHAILMYELDDVEVLDLNTLCQETAKRLKLTDISPNSKVNASDLPKVNGYKIHWLRLFEVIIHNGLYYQGDNPEPLVEVTASVDGDRVILAFDDNGIGIPENRREEVTSIFRRLHAQSDYDGIGMGLADCARIMEMNGGDISFSSSSLGGIRVECSFPADKVLPQSA